MPSKKANVSMIMDPAVHKIIKEYCQEMGITVSSFISGILEDSAPKLKYLTKEIRRLKKATMDERNALVEKYTDIERVLTKTLDDLEMKSTSDEEDKK